MYKPYGYVSQFAINEKRKIKRRRLLGHCLKDMMFSQPESAEQNDALSKFGDDSTDASSASATAAAVRAAGLPAGTMPVGRLDEKSEGLLLLTTDGKLCHALCSSGTEKEYYVQVRLVSNQSCHSHSC